MGSHFHLRGGVVGIVDLGQRGAQGRGGHEAREKGAGEHLGRYERVYVKITKVIHAQSMVLLKQELSINPWL